jgi:2-oxoglutarate dehydrogenase E2 component (dihydrolipoamide succinyltransferase)
MAIDIKVPTFPESVNDGTLIEWYKAEGEPVARDELLAEIETDKVVFEVRAPEEGVVESLRVKQGATVDSEQVIATLKADGAAGKPEAKPASQEASASEGSGEVSQTKPSAAETGENMTPAAKKMIEEQGLAASDISGSGRHGQILKEDVQHYLDSQQQAPAQTEARAPTPSPVPGEADRPQKRVPMSRLRAKVAERLLEAQHDAAILTTFNEINMQPVMNLRQQYRELFEKKHKVKLGFMSFFVKATLEALKRFPQVNASIEDKEIVYHGFYDIGIAVGSPRGLVVPILRDADILGMAEIEERIADFGARAQSGALSLEEITGGTFSITNGGVFGSLLSTPILNPPQSAILGMHKIEKRPVVEDDEIVIRPMMYVALSYDHRIIDGREAVQFLVIIKEMIEDPARILLEI